MIAALVIALWCNGHVEERRATVYLEFDGGILAPGTNAALDEASCVQGEPFVYPAYQGTYAQRDAIGEAARAFVEPYGIRIRWRERPPAHLPYARVMVGGDPTSFDVDPRTGGVACEVDCGEVWPRDAAFAFALVVPPEDTNTVAAIAVHEAAHTWGLEHVAGEENLMFEFVPMTPQTLAEECVPLVGGGCDHSEACPDGGQNTHAELLALFGTNTLDTTAPTVRILTPEDGAHVRPGTQLEVEIEVEDDHERFGWKFSVPELDWERVAYDEETSLVLAVPEGELTLEVEAVDHDLNVGRDRVRLRVDQDAPPSGSDETGTDGDSSGTGASGPALERGSGDGCGCSTGGLPDGGLLFLLLLVGPRRQGASTPARGRVRG